METEINVDIFFKNQTISVAEYFEQWLYPTNSEFLEYEGIPLKKPIFDEIHNILGETNKHNCIGCNLSDGVKIINKFLQINKGCENESYYLTIYSLLFYLQAERLAVIYKEMGYKIKEKFDWTKFPILQNIKYWANFFKHPKAFMFIHHPTFHIASDSSNPNFSIDGIVDDEFVKKYFSSETKNREELFQKLSNKNWKIFFPDLVDTTKKLCAEFEKVIALINNDKTIIEKLKEMYSK